jgi:predicted O-methyltransferase YrrM
MGTYDDPDIRLAAALEARQFQFGRVDGSQIALLTLLPDGSIAGRTHGNETSWSIKAGNLVFHDGAGAPTTVFHQIDRSGAAYALRGAFLPQGPQIWHTLTQTGANRGIIQELLAELYGGDAPFRHADPAFRDTGYPHTNLLGDIVASIIDAIQPAFWLEIGSMLGGSAIRVADVVKSRHTATDIICIDPFTGDVNMWAWEQPRKRAGDWSFLRLRHGRPTIYDRFLANVAAAGHDDIILPITATSIVGIKLLRRLLREGRISAVPGVIYLDSAHEPDETFLELRNCWDLLEPGGVLMGDDWGWEAVRGDVLRFAGAVELNREARQRLADHHKRFTEQDGVLLDRGQWVLLK